MSELKTRTTQAPFFLIAPKCDAGSLDSAGASMRIAFFDDAELDALPTLGDRRISRHDLASHCVGGLAASAAGLKALSAFMTSDADATGCPALPICDLTSTDGADYERPVCRFVANSLGLMVERQARRAVTLSKSLAVLRQEHERTQSAFARLERFVLGNNLAARTKSLAMLPGREMTPVRLADGESLVQRLPIASAGLSDVGLFIDDIETADGGTLSVVLSTLEDGAERGRWEVSGEALAPGQVRLSLRAGLEAEAMTPILEIFWQGEGSLDLGASLLHPDPRFQVQIGEAADPRVLAVQCWTYLPGSEAPTPLGAILAADGASGMSRKRVVDGATLSSAVNLTPESEHFMYLPEIEALQVHPLPSGISACVIESVAPAGTIHVVARIHTRSERASDIEYAIAVGPPLNGDAAPAAFQETEEMLMSPWVMLKALEHGEVHLPLAAPLGEPAHLYLMTRLASQTGDASWGWATFDQIRLTLE